MLPDFEPGTRVKLNGGGMQLHRKLTQHGGQGIAFGNGHLSQAEAVNTFVWIGNDGGRNAIVRSEVSGREGMIGRSMFRRA